MQWPVKRVNVVLPVATLSSFCITLRMNVLLRARYIDQDPFGYRDRNSVKTNLSKIITKNNFGKYNGPHTHNLEC